MKKLDRRHRTTFTMGRGGWYVHVCKPRRSISWWKHVGAWRCAAPGRRDDQALGSGGLATAQHLCGALVGLVNPGLVGISLREGKRNGGLVLIATFTLITFISAWIIKDSGGQDTDDNPGWHPDYQSPFQYNSYCNCYTQNQRTLHYQTQLNHLKSFPPFMTIPFYFKNKPHVCVAPAALWRHASHVQPPAVELFQSHLLVLLQICSWVD